MTSIWYRRVAYCSVLLMFSGCMTTVPIGPRVAVMPAPGKPFEVFAAEEHLCRQYAEQSIGLSPDAAASNQAAYASRDAQWRYDNAYTQCMYAKGNQVSGYQYQRQVTPPPPNSGYRQPAPNFPPPPPQ